MAEPNPYDPPRETERLTKGQVRKRQFGLGVILLLTPPAVAIAVISCCSAEQVLPEAMRQSVVFGGPPAVLAALMILAAVVAWPRNDMRKRTWSQVAILLATPVAVLVGWGGGFALAALVYSIAPGADNRLIVVWGWATAVVFYLVPGLTLLGMLWLAWRAGR